MSKTKIEQPADTFAAEFAEAVNEAQITLADLARETGYSWSALFKWRHNLRVPPPGTQKHVMALLKAKALARLEREAAAADIAREQRTKVMEMMARREKGWL